MGNVEERVEGETRSFEWGEVRDRREVAEEVDRRRQGIGCRMDIGEVRDGVGGLKATGCRGSLPFYTMYVLKADRSGVDFSTWGCCAEGGVAALRGPRQGCSMAEKTPADVCF